MVGSRCVGNIVHELREVLRVGHGRVPQPTQRCVAEQPALWGTVILRDLSQRHKRPIRQLSEGTGSDDSLKSDKLSFAAISGGRNSVTAREKPRKVRHILEPTLAHDGFDGGVGSAETCGSQIEAPFQHKLVG